MCYLKSSPLTDRVKAGKKLQGEINAEHLKINAFHRQNAIYRVLVFIRGWLPTGMTSRKALLKLLSIFTTAVGTTGAWQGCGPVPEPAMTKLPCGTELAAKLGPDCGVRLPGQHRQAARGLLFILFLFFLIFPAAERGGHRSPPPYSLPVHCGGGKP